MPSLKQNLIESLKSAVKENARQQTKIEIRSLITRHYPDQATMGEVNDIFSIVSIPAPSTGPSKYKIYTPDFGIKKKSAPQPKVVVADKEEVKVKEAPDDLTIDQIINTIKEDNVEKVFGSIEAFQRYTEERFGVEYGRKSAKASIFNHFLERISVEQEQEDAPEEDDDDLFND